MQDVIYSKPLTRWPLFKGNIQSSETLSRALIFHFHRDPSWQGNFYRRGTLLMEQTPSCLYRGTIVVNTSENKTTSLAKLRGRTARVQPGRRPWQQNVSHELLQDSQCSIFVWTTDRLLHLVVKCCRGVSISPT